MTEPTNHDDVLRSSPLLVVEAFADGERVEPGALVEALADSAAREHLVHLLVLREAITEMSPSTVRAGAARRLAGPRSPWLAAAAAVVLSLGLGYAVGQRAIEPVVEAATAQTVVQIDTPPPPPMPTDVITLQPGVDWAERAGEP